MRSKPPTPRGSSTATSSRPTSSSPSAATPSCSISGWQGRRWIGQAMTAGPTQEPLTDPGRGAGNAGVHVARTGSWRSARRPHRPLFARRRALRDDDRPAGVRGQHAGHDPRGHPEPDADSGGTRESRVAAEARRGHQQGAGKGPEAAIPARVGAARRPAAPEARQRLRRRSRRAGSEAPLAGASGWRRRGPLLAAAAVAVVALLAAGMQFSGLRSKGEAIDSVAVLPFVNSSGDADGEYLSDGITESLIANLSQVRSLRVTARSTVFRYKGKEIDPQKIGQDLHVGAVLSGRLLQRDGTLVVRTELMDVTNGTQLWGGQYNRKVADVFALQDELSKEISERLRLRLTDDEKQRLTKRYTDNAEAYQLYLKGLYLLEQAEPGRPAKGDRLLQPRRRRRSRVCAGVRGPGRQLQLACRSSTSFLRARRCRRPKPPRPRRWRSTAVWLKRTFHWPTPASRTTGTGPRRPATSIAPSRSIVRR